MRRREAPMIGLNSRQTQTPPRFSTLRVALRCQCKTKYGNIEVHQYYTNPQSYFIFKYQNG